MRTRAQCEAEITAAYHAYREAFDSGDQLGADTEELVMNEARRGVRPHPPAAEAMTYRLKQLGWCWCILVGIGGTIGGVLALLEREHDDA